MPKQTPTVNSERLWNSLMQMAKIGPGIKGGNNRQALTDADAQARSLFAKWCEDAGCRLTIDSMGNMFARRDGMDSKLSPIVLGSHLDTQPTGGKYDGVLGVLAGLEVIRTLNDYDIKTRHPIEVVNWTNEEGTRFAPCLQGSSVFTGVLDEKQTKQAEDYEGKNFKDELQRIGFEGEEKCGAHPIAAYFELHIEQGPILEAENLAIGVVTAAQGDKWLKLTMTGKEAHSGSTPMTRRFDAGLSATRISNCVHYIALVFPPYAVGTVGTMAFYPNSRNIIPGKAVMTIDFRHPDDTTLEAMSSMLLKQARDITEKMGITLEVEVEACSAPVQFHEGLVSIVREAATSLGYSNKDMVSGGGHDACALAAIVPTAMIFCPCIEGISHNEDEEILPQWAKAGADVLCQAALKADMVEMSNGNDKQSQKIKIKKYGGGDI